MNILLLCGLLLMMPAEEPKDGLPPRAQFMVVEKAIRLPNNDWLVYRYGAISDSGVELFRMDAVMTKERWRYECKNLGVTHSKYYHHADVELKNNDAIITSTSNHGHGRSFVETVNFETGKQVSRTEK